MPLPPTIEDPKTPWSSRHPFLGVLEAEDRRSLRLQLAFFLLAGLLLVLLLDLTRSPSNHEATSSTPPCPQGQSRHPTQGHCVDLSTIAPSLSCETGALKTDACLCDGDRHVDPQGRCKLRPSDPKRCEVARSILKKCGEQRGGKISSQCSALEIFQHSALDEDDTEAILASFPDTMTVHFDEGKPASRTAPKALKKPLEERRAAFTGASAIYLLGRADNSSGSPTDNDRMALTRLDATRRAILKASGLNGKEQSQLDAKIINFGLGHHRKLDIERFGRRYTKILHAEDERAARLLENELTKYREGKLSSQEKENLEAALNRSVQIIIVTSCDLGEAST